MNGKHKQEILVQHHSIGAAAESANRWKEWKKYINDVGKATELYGTQVSETFTSHDACNIDVYVIK